jgi:hypothetical protein
MLKAFEVEVCGDLIAKRALLSALFSKVRLWLLCMNASRTEAGGDRQQPSSPMKTQQADV